MQENCDIRTHSDDRRCSWLKDRSLLSQSPRALQSFAVIVLHIRCQKVMQRSEAIELSLLPFRLHFSCHCPWKAVINIAGRTASKSGDFACPQLVIAPTSRVRNQRCGVAVASLDWMRSLRSTCTCICTKRPLIIAAVRYSHKSLMTRDGMDDGKKTAGMSNANVVFFAGGPNAVRRFRQRQLHFITDLLPRHRIRPLGVCAESD